jgi:excisionase family DNA binding protein
VPNPLSEELRYCLSALLQQLSDQLLRRAVSPRIRHLDIEQVCEAFGLGKSTIYQMIEEGRFPRPQRNLGKNRWRESTLIAWCDANDPNRDKLDGKS